MATKPTPGASDGTYGTELNAFLDVSLDVDGKIATEALQTDATAPSADAAVANKKYVDDHGVIQVVNAQSGAVVTSTTAIALDDTIPQQSTDGALIAALNAAITPTSATSKLLIEVSCSMTAATAGKAVMICLYQDATENALAVTGSVCPASTFWENVTLRHFMTAGTVVETTFKVHIGSDASTVYLNGVGGTRRMGGVLISSVTVTELEG